MCIGTLSLVTLIAMYAWRLHQYKGPSGETVGIDPGKKGREEFIVSYERRAALTDPADPLPPPPPPVSLSTLSGTRSPHLFITHKLQQTVVGVRSSGNNGRTLPQVVRSPPPHLTASSPPRLGPESRALFRGRGCHSAFSNAALPGSGPSGFSCPGLLDPLISRFLFEGSRPTRAAPTHV